MAQAHDVTPEPDESGPPPSRAERLGHLQPFALDICPTYHEADARSSAPLHELALEELRSYERRGQLTLLSAPRAGHGKTHLLGRVAARLKDDAVVAALPWQTREGLAWAACGRGVLHDLAGGVAHPTPWQRVCGGVLATLLRRLIQTGRIPSADPVQALRVLSQDPMALFSSDGQARVIGDWFRRHFERLCRPMAEISVVGGTDAVEDWLRGFYECLDQGTSEPLAALDAKLEQDSEAQTMRLFRLIATWKPLVLLADHMDALYRNPDAGVEVARLALELSSVPGVQVVLSMNQDLWETTFGRNLPSALEDRLNARSVSLHGLTEEDARALVSVRLQEAGVFGRDALDFMKFLDLERFFLGRPIGSVSARGLLRHVSQMWRHWLAVGEGAPQDEALPPSVEEPVPAEGFLLPEAPEDEPLPVTAPQTPEEDLEKLAAHLAQDAGGLQVDLSQPVEPPPAPDPWPPPVKPMVPPESLLMEPAKPVPVSAPAPLASVTAPVLSEVNPMTFQKLRQMLAKLKVATDSVPLGTSNGNAASPPPTASAIVKERFEVLRQEIAATPRPQAVELPVLGELVRLAGRRFPVVSYDEVELPGLLGRSLPRWSLHGLEVVFGLESFSEARYWRTLSSYVAGRLAELEASEAQNCGPVPQLKLVVFKGGADNAGLSALLKDDTLIPTALRAHVDAVHLDPRSLANLYAMHQLVREAETGELKADVNAVLAALAGELDFFWRRVTRPKP